tara:strand:+ start:1072 stop:1545 length:474 start_codon:yes stop_codon:yes gene_type:complete
MDIQKMEEAIEKFIDLMNKNDLSELELEHGGIKIRLKKGADIHTQAVPFVTPMETTELPAGSAPPPTEPVEAQGSDTIEIPSPLVGTFFSSPAPDAEPFIEVGDDVDTETVLCIVEAMKVMNEIKSEVEGTIVDVLVENGQPVEYGQILFLIEPSGS